MADIRFDEFIIKQLSKESELPVYVVDNVSGKPVAAYSQKGNIEELYRKNSTLLKKLVSTVKKDISPTVIILPDFLCFGVYGDAQKHCHIWGPCSLNYAEGLISKENSGTSSIINLSTQIPGSWHKMTLILSIAFYSYTDRKIDPLDIYAQWLEQNEEYQVNPADVELYRIEQDDEEKRYNSADFERELMDCISNGDTKHLEQLMSISINELDGVGIPARDQYKQMEYFCISCITLVTRAAIRGGLKPETAFELSDVYMQKIEKCRSAEELAKTSLGMEMDFAERVAAEKGGKKRNVIVEAGKDYIAKHLRKPFQIGKMAEELETNSTYLSRIFKQSTGLTIQQYISYERCKHAANLLKFSDFSILRISQYFCFSSQSHFGRQFKAIYGITPGEYRKQNMYYDKKW